MVSVPFVKVRCACTSVYEPLTGIDNDCADSVESSTRTNCTPESAGAEDVGTSSVTKSNASMAANIRRVRVKRIIEGLPQKSLETLDRNQIFVLLL